MSSSLLGRPLHLAMVAAVLALVASFAMPATTDAKRPPTNTNIPVNGQVTTTTMGAFDVAGLLNLTEVQNVGGVPTLIGTFTGTLTHVGSGAVTNVTNQAVQIPLTSSGPGNSCQILFLDLEGLFLDVLGLQVILSQVILEVRAVPGPGNLLGNLLCALVGILDPQGQNPLNQNLLTNLLGRINNLLQ
jgi:hypothetical protein